MDARAGGVAAAGLPVKVLGLGDAARVVRLTITLPDGRQMELRDVAANQIIAPVIDGTSALTTP